MAAYAALLSLARATDLCTTRNQSLFSSDAVEKVRSIHDYADILLQFFEEFPQKVNRWESRIRDVAHEIEDIVQVFMWRRVTFIYPRKAVQRASRHSAINPSGVKLEDQLEIVMEKIGLIAGEVMEERPAYLPPSSSSSSPSRISSTGNDAVVGLDGDIMAMKELLCGHPSDLRVVSIVGTGGIGKSTLARTLYEDQLIIETFDIRAWVVVSQDYSPSRFKRVLLGSIKTLKEQVFGDVMDESDIELRVFQNLKGWRYLVVVDDVWGTHVWDDVRYMFPNDKNGSRIVLTTRQLDVATYPCSTAPVHEMQFMSDSQCWDLLKQKAFANSYYPSELEEVGKEIARRCAGLPLAVVLVAGVLSPVNRTRASWEDVAKHVNPAFGREIEEILSLSYTYLPHHLRPCFLFIGGFLEDRNISTSRLIKLWVAEGFVKLKHGCAKSMEDEAEEYLEDLVKKNLVIATSRKSDGKIKSCSLHDMVRGLCIWKAREEKFLHVMDGHDLPQGLMNEQRISFSRSDINTIWGPTLHTILCFQTQSFSSWLALIGSYKLLRVFDALGVDLKELPSEAFELYHLRYLALTGSFSIPRLVYNLVNLQTLIVHLASGKLWGSHDDRGPHPLPLEIWRMPQLRHLFFHAPCTLPHPLEAINYLPLENLQTLSFVKDLVWNEVILKLIPNVKRLRLYYTTGREYRLHYLKDLHHLVKLEVTGSLNFSWSIQTPSFPCTLKKLTLAGGGFPWKDMAVVGSLPFLEVLKLLHHSCDGDTWETSDEEFPQLKVLLIDESHLRQWITHGRRPLPMLKRLVLHSCSYLQEIPEGLGEIPTLELIEVDHCRNSLVESAKNIKEERESFGNYALQVCIGLEEIESVHKQMDPSPSIPEASSFNEDLIEIKERLIENSSKLQVVTIVGMCGIGKTMLAATVCYDPLILEHFEVRVWLTVSQIYNPRGSRKSLLGLAYSMKLLEEEVSLEKISESEMASAINRNLTCRRYLVVIDDVWDTNVWDDIRYVFPDDGNGSRIMLTSKLLHMNADAPPHLMGFMYDHESWILLKKKVFGNRSFPPDLEDVGKEIARRCAGLPLSVVLIAGVLSAADETRAAWDEIAGNINSNVGPELQKIIHLSYSQLPHRLRPCFLYMGVFAKDESIYASTLIKSWVAEGVLKHETGCSRSLEEEAEEYLEDLVKRNLVSVTSRTNDGRIESCSLHDLIRDFCISKWEEEMFYGWNADREHEQGLGLEDELGPLLDYRWRGWE